MSRHLTPNGRGLGWRPSLPRHGRAMFGTAPVALPSSIDLRSNCPPVYDQGQLGSCTGNALAFAMQFDRIKQNLNDAERVPSRLMIYWGERNIEGTVDSDSGAQGFDGIQFLQSSGTCFEDGSDGWPYDISKFTVRPPDACWTAAITNKAATSLQVAQDLYQLRACLAGGWPIAFGFTCYSGLDSDAVANGTPLSMPDLNEDPIGGHEVALVGYDDTTRMFLVRNSWGTGWGINGHFWMPYEYVIRQDLASDFETIRLVA